MADQVELPPQAVPEQMQVDPNQVPPPDLGQVPPPGPAVGVEEPPPDPGADYAGPKEDQLVGEKGTLNVIGVSSEFDGTEVRLGDAWQNQAGELHGTGVAAVMLFEPASRLRYSALSLENDYSPLTILAKRLSRCTLARTELVLSDDNSQ